MRTKRALLTLLITLIVVSAMAVPATAASPFTDVGGTPYEAAIDNLASMEIVGGYEDGTFRPGNSLWRAQYAKMVVVALGYTVSADHVSAFIDTPDASADNPLYPGAYVAVAAENQIILGYPDNTFRFYNNVTRQQAITIIVRAAGAELADPPAGYQGALNYSDPTHGQNIKKAEFNGLLDGIATLDSWDTGGNATRGESAQLLSNLLAKAFSLRVTGLSGTQLFSMTDLQAMSSIEGYGGTKNRLGTIVGPDRYEGVAVLSLLSGVGGLPEGCGVRMTASDGYSASFTYDQIADADFTMYDPSTGAPVTAITGEPQMIVAYSKDGNPLESDVGPLRTAIVSPAAEQVTDGGKWAKMVVRIEVASLEVHNGDTVKVFTLSELRALAAVQGYGGTKNKAGVIAGPAQYGGAAILSVLDEVGGLPEGSGIKVTASDGFSTSFAHDDVTNAMFPMYDPATGEARASITGALQMIVAYAKDGNPLSSDDGGPLRIALVSPAAEQVTDGGKWPKSIVKIEVQEDEL